MPTLVLTTSMADELGVARPDLLGPTLSVDAGRLLEALLMSRGFDLGRTVHVSEMVGGSGFVLTQ
jgi:hypothetical protein